MSVEELEMVEIDFALARDLAWFELNKGLTVLQERVLAGGYVSDYEKSQEFRKYEARIDEFIDDGVNKEELKSLLEEWKTNPIAKKSCSLPQVWNLVIEDIELLLSDTDIPEITPEHRIRHLLDLCGYKGDEAYEEITDAGFELIQAKKYFNMYDAVIHVLKERTSDKSEDEKIDDLITSYGYKNPEAVKLIKESASQFTSEGHFKNMYEAVDYILKTMKK